MYDDEIEKSVLYYMIFEKEELQIEEKDFMNDRNIKIAKAIIQLQKEKKDISMLSVQSKIRANQHQVIEYISDLGNNVYGSTAESSYNKLKTMRKKRDLFNLTKKITQEIEQQENIDEYMQDCIKNINEISKENEKQETFIEQLVKTTEEIEKNYNKRNDYSLYTGIYDLDDLTCGLHNKELTIIGARPGVGKTTLTLQIAEHITKKKKEVVFISLEMAETQLIQKLIAKETNINTYKMKKGTLEEKDFEKIADVIPKITDLSLNINTKIRNIQQLETYAKKMKNKNKLDLLIIDYIQLLKSKDKFNSREQEVADISRRLKLLTLELDIPIIALCQLNRNANEKEPTLADLRESGSLEQDADNIIFIYKENEESTETILKLAKQRAGSTGKVKVLFNKSTSEFKNILK